MSRVLLVDTNFSAYPIRSALINAGYDVFTVGGRPDHPLAASTANYIKLDYSDEAALERLIKQHRFEYLVPGCTDKSYEVCARIASGLGFGGFEDSRTLSKLQEKAQFRMLCEELSLPAPLRFGSEEDALDAGCSVIVKPVDAYSGLGITVLETPRKDSLSQAVTNAQAVSQQGGAIIEEYVSGQLYSYSAFIKEGAVIKAFSVKELGSVNPFVVDTSHVCFDHQLAASVQRDVEKLARSVGLNSGLLHMQYISDGAAYWLIEPTRRCPGDLYSELIERSSGYPYAASYTAAFLRRDPITDYEHRELHVVRRTIASDRHGVFKSLSFSGGYFPDVWYPLAKTGDMLQPSPGGRIAIAFYRVADLEEREALVQSLVGGDAIKVQYVEDHHG